MKSGIKVGITVLAVALLAFAAFKFVAKNVGESGGYPVWALFRDATGLVDKSRVQTAGLVIGEIKDRRLQGNWARVTIKVKQDVQIWSNATLYKKSASLLGEFYLEIDPGTQFSPDALTGRPKENYLLHGCEKRTGRHDCNQIVNVVEAVTIGDVVAQVNETVPVLRDILLDVRRVTEGPLHDIVKEVHEDIAKNADAAERMLKHIDDIALNVRDLTGGASGQDLRQSIENVRQITENIKQLVGPAEAGKDGNAGLIRRDLEKFSQSLDKLNSSLDNVARITGDVRDLTAGVNRGEGTVGRLLKDDAIAENVGNITEDVSGFVRSLTRLQTIVGIREEYNILANSYKTYLSIKLMPRPDKYYLIELVDDPRGSRTYSHTLQAVGTGGTQTLVNTDTWTRGSAFRFTFMFAKRIEPWGRFGLTGRVGLKEGTGGVGVDIDFWHQRFQLQIDIFDLMTERWPRLKILAALEVFKHIWLVGGVDDVINRSGSDPKPDGITCGPSTPSSWCSGGRDYFVGAQLTFNDDDLRNLLTIGANAASTLVTSKQ